MGLFKSNREKTVQALRNAASACAQEAETKFKQIIFAYEKGRSKNDPYISAFMELYKAIYGHDVLAENEYGPPLMYEVRTDMMGMFTRACIYYIYLNLMIALIRKENNKHLSREALEELEKSFVVSDKCICKLFPRGAGFDEKVEIYVFGTWKDNPWPYHRPVQELFEDLRKILLSKNTKCLDFIPKLSSIPGTKELIAQIEDYDFATALITLDKIIN